jgi:protein SCO1/2
MFLGKGLVTPPQGPEQSGRVPAEKRLGMTKYSAVLAVLVVVAGIGLSGWYALTRGSGDRFADCRESQVSGGTGSIGGPFTLTDQDGNTVTQADVITGPALLYFGYTFCPDVCPLDNARNAEATDILEERGIDVTPVFISVDPARDTPEVLKSYTQNLHPRMIGLTGTDDQIRAATQAYKAYFRIQPSGDEFYLVDHSTFTYLVLPEAGFVEFFRRDTTPDEMADRIACFVGAA